MRGEFFGDTHFERIRGPVKFHTSRTDFQLARLDGQIDISSGSALSTSEAVGPLTLTTHSRNITLDRIAGDVSVTNRNGSVDVTSAPPLSNVTVENRNGSVTVTVPEQSNFAYQFDATNGDIESDFSQIKSPGEDSQKRRQRHHRQRRPTAAHHHQPGRRLVEEGQHHAAASNPARTAEAHRFAPGSQRGNRKREANSTRGNRTGKGSAEASRGPGQRSSSSRQTGRQGS